MESGCCPIPPPQSRAKKNFKFNEYTPTGATGNIIADYLAQQDVAPWYRGTSYYHIKGASELLNALRDDIQQETTHRVRSCLSLIGLKPMVTSKQMKFLMNLSRGNDLVFLWFLMENHYKTPKTDPTAYSQNEQLICSAICHLDSVATLRELDRLLPIGQSSKSPAKNILAKRSQDAQHPVLKGGKKGLSGKQRVLPYFVKQNLPKQYGKSLVLKRPNFIVQFKLYKVTNELVPNETNRWFANYEFNIGKRIVFKILHEIMKNIFLCSQADYLKLKTANVLCGYHNKMKQIRENLRHQHKLKIRDMLFKHCARYNETEYEKRNRIKDMLEQSALQQLRIITKKPKKPDTLLAVTSDCQVLDVLIGDNEFVKGDEKSKSKTDKSDSQRKEQANAYKNNNEPCFYSQGGNFPGSQEVVRTEEIDVPKRPAVKSNSRHDLSPNQENEFFTRPTGDKPYKFNYPKIFGNMEVSEAVDIRKLILDALNENTSRLSREKQQSQLLYYDAVNNGIQKIFDNAAEKFEKEKFAEAAAQGRSTALSQYPPNGKYDPEDYTLMDKMLADAFQELRKNPKFVWAQLPDAHKMPFLREWIVQRYGKEYTPADRIDSFNKSSAIYRALERKQLKTPLPTVRDVGENMFIDYSCRNYVHKKVQKIKNEYYQHLDNYLLGHTRVFWFAMRGHLCSNGPPRKSFFAYMPSRLADIQHFRLWKQYEYRDQWSAWNRRQQELKQSQQN